ncbi:ABC transporter permease [Marinicrinis lubricantis]|uniref:ABC transporter permease n=1 Tax=Marinicrinis lubricantis TaxID=2086470 RepID=A0ABW1ILA5_9BACL
MFDALLNAFNGSVEQGLLYAFMALGVYISFRILDFPDLTVDGSFTTGAAVAAVLMTNGYSPYIATFGGFLAGCAAGAVTGLLHTKGKINNLLSGILMMIALYSINLKIMGQANTPLFGQDTIISYIPESALIWVMGVVVIIAKLLLDWFLHTEVGMALRATGDNPKMIRSFGVNTDTTIITGISLSNGLVALSGALVAQYQGFADLQMGVGMIVIGLASVIIGEALFGLKTVFRTTLAVVLGAIVYRFVLALALEYNMDPAYMKLITALIVIIALTIPRIRKSIQQKKVAAERGRQLSSTAGDSIQKGGGIRA